MAIRNIEAPFIPRLRSITDTSYFPTEELDQVPDEPAGGDTTGAHKELAFLGYVALLSILTPNRGFGNSKLERTDVGRFLFRFHTVIRSRGSRSLRALSDPPSGHRVLSYLAVTTRPFDSVKARDKRMSSAIPLFPFLRYVA